MCSIKLRIDWGVTHWVYHAYFTMFWTGVYFLLAGLKKIIGRLFNMSCLTVNHEMSLSSMILFGYGKTKFFWPPFIFLKLVILNECFRIFHGIIWQLASLLFCGKFKQHVANNGKNFIIHWLTLTIRIIKVHFCVSELCSKYV